MFVFLLLSILVAVTQANEPLRGRPLLPPITDGDRPEPPSGPRTGGGRPDPPKLPGMAENNRWSPLKLQCNCSYSAEGTRYCHADACNAISVADSLVKTLEKANNTMQLLEKSNFPSRAKEPMRMYCNELRRAGLDFIVEQFMVRNSSFFGEALYEGKKEAILSTRTSKISSNPPVFEKRNTSENVSFLLMTHIFRNKCTFSTRNYDFLNFHKSPVKNNKLRLT